jgi:uncharacterized protein YlxW (UPF0749 family)
VATPLVLGLSGALFLMSATSSDGTDLRSGRVTTMAGLVESESNRAEALQEEVAEMRAEVDALAGTVPDSAVRRARGAASALRPAAGLSPVTGEGITVTLSDAPREVRETSERDLRLLVVHQQDIQAVVNAMWRAGAQAITIQGQRIITTTGIKCAGSSVELQGIPYPQPYEITAIGDTAGLSAAMDSDPTIQRYRAQALLPDIAIGWSMAEERLVTAPAYEGAIGLDYAQPAT